MSTLLELSFLSCPTKMSQVRDKVRTALDPVGLSDEEKLKLVLVIDEACTNIMRHAYAGDCSREINLKLDHEQAPELSRLVFELRDQAATIDSSQIKPRDLDDCRPGGLGVNIMDTVMDDWQFEEPDCGNGNILRMSKNISREDHE